MKSCPTSSELRELSFTLGPGYAEVPNPLFYYSNTKMLFGDAKESCEGLSRGLKENKD